MAMQTLRKSEFVAKIAEASGLSKKDAASALEGLCAVIKDEVVGGKAVMLPGIGKIQCRERAERTIRNPATGESMVKAADRAIKVAVSKAFKDAANS